MYKWDHFIPNGLALKAEATATEQISVIAIFMPTTESNRPFDNALYTFSDLQ